MKDLTVVVVVVVVGAALVLLAAVALVTPPSRVALPTVSSVAAANVTISGYPGEIAIDPNTSRIYVSDLFNNTLTVVDASTYAVIDTIVLPGTSESGVAVDMGNNMVYVPVSGCTNEVNVTNSCNSSGGSVLKGGIVEIDGNTDSIVGEIPIGVDSLAIDPSTGMLYAVSWNQSFDSNSSASLLTIDERSGSVIANTSLGAFPLSVAVDAKTGMVYVSACERLTLACVGAELLFINGTSHDLQSVVPLGFDILNFNVVVDPTTNAVYTMGSGAGRTLVSVDGTTGKIRYSSAIGSSCAGGVLALNSVSNLIYVSYDVPQFLLTVDGSTGKVVNMLNTTEGIQYAAFNSRTLQTYVTMEAQNENVGYLLVVPGLNEGHVNSSASQGGGCFP